MVLICCLQLLTSYLSIPRSEGPEVIMIVVEQDAKALYKAGEKRWELMRLLSKAFSAKEAGPTWLQSVLHTKICTGTH